tara:strand:+ start:254 stop:616 length:363 start_codon:yes stop_codon:yes gene_type:complete
MKYVRILRFAIWTYLTVALLCLAAIFACLAFPWVSVFLSRIPTPIAGLFGAAFAVSGGFLVATWRYEEEKKDKVKNLCTLLGNENNYFISNLTYILDTLRVELNEYDQSMIGLIDKEKNI